MENSTQPSFFVPRECIHSHQMGPGSQITLFGKCTFRIPSGYLPDFTRDKFEPFQVSLLQTNMENSKKPSGFTSGNPSGTFRIPSGTQRFHMLYVFFVFLLSKKLQTVPPKNTHGGTLELAANSFFWPLSWKHRCFS